MDKGNKVLVLGSTGMLGSTVKKYYESAGFLVETNSHRWPSEELKQQISSFDGVLILNCIGGIHQNYDGSPDFYKVNYELPIFISNNSSSKVIQPDTDCVFSGNIGKGQLYDKNDAPDATGDYAESKSELIKRLSQTQDNLKVFRTSIIGFDKNKVSLLSWFLSQENECSGFDFHYWNGLTTLQWAKESLTILVGWGTLPKVIQLAPEPISKYDLLCLFREVFDKNTKINLVSKDEVVNKCLKSDWDVPTLKEQLILFREFYS